MEKEQQQQQEQFVCVKPLERRWRIEKPVGACTYYTVVRSSRGKACSMWQVRAHIEEGRHWLPTARYGHCAAVNVRPFRRRMVFIFRFYFGTPGPTFAPVRRHFWLLEHLLFCLLLLPKSQLLLISFFLSVKAPVLSVWNKLKEK